MRVFETKLLGAAPDAVAPDGTAVRLLAALSGGSFAHFELPAGAASHAVVHRTVEEIWCFVAGHGELWRRAGEHEEVVAVGPGVCGDDPARNAVPVPRLRPKRRSPSSPSPCRPGRARARRRSSRGDGRRRSGRGHACGSALLPARASALLAICAREPHSARRISSVVEQRFCKPKVGGSIPSSGTSDLNSPASVPAI